MNLLTTKEAAERLGVTARRIRQLVEEKKLRSTYHGRDLAIEKTSLDRLKRKREQPKP
jgi:excisionase family DNA binding protein